MTPDSPKNLDPAGLAKLLPPKRQALEGGARPTSGSVASGRRHALRMAAVLGFTVLLSLASTRLMPPGRAASWKAAPSVPSGPRGNGLLAMVSDRGGEGEIYSMYPDGTEQTNLSRDGEASDSQPAWSPDGAMVAFTTDRNGNDEVYTMRADGTGQVNLTHAPGSSESDPAWSPTGRKIAFTTDRDGNREIYVMRPDGTGQTNLSRDPAASDAQPAWSPDGRWLAFTSNRTGDEEVFVMRADGTGVRNLSHVPGASDSEPAWSPDGASIAFTSNRDGDDEVYVMNADGSGQTNLTRDAGASDSEPVFSPDGGTRLAFASDRSGSDAVWLLNVYLPTRLTYGLVTITHQPPERVTSWQPLPPVRPWHSPIRHVIVFFQENHSFDNVLGKLCVQDARCDGVTQGETDTGDTIPLPPAHDIGPSVPHSYETQTLAINGGRMNGFSLVTNCGPGRHFACYQQYDPSQIPSLSALARAFVISDATFESDTVGSWGGHLDLAASQLDGFYTGRPEEATPTDGSWGCDGTDLGSWAPTPTDPTTGQPTCIPKPDATGPFTSTMVPWIPTIMDRMDSAGRTWKIYAPQKAQTQYGWSICPTFADCIFSPQRANFVGPEGFPTDAANGTLPNLSLVIPLKDVSQHNGRSMLAGDNYLSKYVKAVMDGPQWGSTAIFITYDDCGCFYDHVPPPSGLGIREPMVIVGPFARPGYTDSNVASFASMLAFTEHVFGLAPLSGYDAAAYDYRQSFDWSQRPLAPIRLTTRPLPRWEVRWLAAHQADDEDDFT